ncbi:DUF2190 family protein [Sphingomonas bisphenolicum]
MSSNFVQPGKVMAFTAPSGGVTDGQVLLIGALIVVAQAAAVQGARFAAALEGVFDVPAATHASSQAWTEGQLLYWDDTAKVFTITVGSNTKKAVAAEAKASTSAQGRVKLIQTL